MSFLGVCVLAGAPVKLPKNVEIREVKLDAALALGLCLALVTDGVEGVALRRTSDDIPDTLLGSTGGFAIGGGCTCGCCGEVTAVAEPTTTADTEATCDFLCASAGTTAS